MTGHDTPGAGAPPLVRLLGDLPARLELRLIDQVWIFPPRQLGGRETGLVVLSALPEDGTPYSRRVLTLRHEIRGTGPGAALSDVLTEQGTAPVDSVQRIIDGVLRRLGDDACEPEAFRIGGDPARWATLLASLSPADG